MRVWLIAAALSVVPGWAQEMLVSTDWLAGKLGDPPLVILHVGTRQDYDAGHIPGARLVTLADISITGERGLRLELPPVEALRGTLGNLGIGEDSRAIVYAGNDSVQSATRVWFTLDYLGLGARASLVDGGLAAWRAEGRAVSTQAPQVTPRQPGVRPRPEVVVDAAWVRAHLGDGGVDLIDARLPQFFSGAESGGMPRAGHIPGARNVPFASLLDPAKKLLGVKALAERLGPGNRTVVTYCHIGQQATMVYFVARMLGREARLYDGSFQDWSTRTELPVEATPAPGPAPAR